MAGRNHSVRPIRLVDAIASNGTTRIKAIEVSIRHREGIMGRLRASLVELAGVKFDRKLCIKRLSDMGITDQDTLKMLTDEMEVAHTRQAFVARIKALGKKRQRYGF